MSNTARNMKYTEQGFLVLRLHFSLDFVDVRFERKTETSFHGCNYEFGAGRAGKKNLYWSQ